MCAYCELRAEQCAVTDFSKIVEHMEVDDIISYHDVVTAEKALLLERFATPVTGDVQDQTGKFLRDRKVIPW